MDYVGQIFRPPSEASSMLLQVSVGCSHNRCAYCAMYRDKTFRSKKWQTIAADIAEAQSIGPRFDRVFLCDGDSLILSTDRLLRILEQIKTELPWVERVGTYGDTRSVLKKSPDDLAALRRAGLKIVYHGMESGDDEVLIAIDKGGTRAQAIETAKKLREAEIDHSVIVLLGVGGKKLSVQHAESTASALSEMDPPFVGALTTTVVANTPLFDAQAAGDFVLPSKFEMLGELRTIIAGSELSKCRFSSNHASNYVPLRGDLPRDRRAMLALLDEVIARGDERLLKPEGLRGL